jgi:hypothetical protein
LAIFCGVAFKPTCYRIGEISHRDKISFLNINNDID